MNDIAILSHDVRFSRMLELELRTSGYSVICNPHGGNARLWLADLDTVTLPTNHPERVYLGMSRVPDALPRDQYTMCLRILARPFDMQALCETLAPLLSPDHVLPSVSIAHPHLLRTPIGYELDGEPLSLTASEERILDAMYQRRGEAIPREELCALLDNETNEKLADVYICLLRRKLEAGGNPRLIFTVRGVGYRLQVED